MGHDPRQEWAKRIERWSDSGLTAKEFAAETGLNANTLMHWKWRLGAEARRRQRSAPTGVSAPAFVEVVAPTATEVVTAAAAPVPVVAASVDAAPADEPLEVVLRDGVRIRVPVHFDAATLRRVVAALAVGR
jgi:hypothetical protein